MKTIIKAPYEEIIEGFDYSDRMSVGATISASTWEYPAGIDGAFAEFDGAASEIEISGGTASTQYKFTNKIETTEGERFQRSFRLLVRDR